MTIKRWIIRTAPEVGLFLAEEDAVRYCEYFGLVPDIAEVSSRLASWEENAVLATMTGPVCWANYHIDDWLLRVAIAGEKQAPFFRRNLVDEIMSDMDYEDDKCLSAYSHMSDREKEALNGFLAILVGCDYLALLRDGEYENLSDDEVLERMAEEEELSVSMAFVSKLHEKLDEDASDALLFYEERDEFARRAIDAFMVYTCGWSIPTLLKKHMGVDE